MNDLQNWMGKLPIDDIPLQNLVIPGSHDSGSYNIKCWSQVSPDSPSKWIALVGCIVAPSSICQRYDIIGQLNIGIRFFDFRVCNRSDCNHNEQWLTHSVYSVKVSKALKDFRKWLNDHPNEIVIINYSFVDGVTTDTTEILGLIGQDIIADNTLTPQSKVSDFVKANKRCILYLNRSTPENFPYWSTSTLSNYWPDVLNVTDLKTKLDASIPNKNTLGNIINISQIIITPDVKMLVEMKYPHYLATLVNPNLSNWLDYWISQEKNPGIALIDFADQITSNIIINKNLK